MPGGPTWGNVSLGTGQSSRGAGPVRPWGYPANGGFEPQNPYDQPGSGAGALQNGTWSPAGQGATSQYGSPFTLQASFDSVVRGMPSNHVASLTEQGQMPSFQGAAPAPQSPAGGSGRSKPSAPPGQAGAMNAQFPGTFNGNPANGVSGTEVGWSPQHAPANPNTPGMEQSYPLTPSAPPGPAPGVPTPGLGMPAMPPQAPTPGAPAAPPPAPSAPPANPTPMPQPPMQGAAGEGTDETRDPSAAPPPDVGIEQVLGAGQAVGTGEQVPGVPAKAAAQTTSGTHKALLGQTQYDVTEPTPPAWAGWQYAQKMQWINNHLAKPLETAAPAPVSTSGPGAPVVTPNGDTYVPPQETAPPGPSAAGDEKSKAGEFNWGGNASRTLRGGGNPDTAAGYATTMQALNRNDIMQAVFGMSNAQAKNYDPLPQIGGNGAGGPPVASANHSFTGLDFPQGAFLEGSPNYIQNSGERQMLAYAYSLASQLNQIASTEGGLASQEYNTIAQKLNDARYVLDWHGIKYQPWGQYGSTGDTAGEFPGVFNETDPNAPSLAYVPGTSKILSPAIRKAFNLNEKSTPEQYAAAYEAQMQGLLTEAAMRDRSKAAAIIGGNADMYRNDPLSTKSTAMAADLLDHPDNTPWQTIENRRVENIDKSAAQAGEDVASSFNRRGIAPGAAAGISSDLQMQAGDERARAISDLAVEKAATEQQAKYQALGAAGDTFNRYRGGEASQRQNLASVLMGSAPDIVNPAGGIGGAALNIKTKKDMAQYYQDMIGLGEDQITLGYFQAGASLLGSMASSGSGAAAA